LQRLLEVGDGFFAAVFVVLGAGEVVPGLAAVRGPFDDFGEPFVGVGKVAQDDVVRGDDFQVARAKGDRLI